MLTWDTVLLCFNEYDNDLRHSMHVEGIENEKYNYALIDSICVIESL